MRANPRSSEMQAVYQTTSDAAALLSSPDLQPVTSVQDFSTELTVSLVTPPLSDLPDGFSIPVNGSSKFTSPRFPFPSHL